MIFYTFLAFYLLLLVNDAFFLAFLVEKDIIKHLLLLVGSGILFLNTLLNMAVGWGDRKKQMTKIGIIGHTIHMGIMILLFVGAYNLSTLFYVSVIVWVISAFILIIMDFQLSGVDKDLWRVR